MGLVFKLPSHNGNKNQLLEENDFVAEFEQFYQSINLKKRVLNKHKKYRDPKICNHHVRNSRQLAAMRRFLAMRHLCATEEEVRLGIVQFEPALLALTLA